MADEQNTPNPDETTPIEPVVVADQGPAEVSAPVAASSNERSPWIHRGLVAAGVVGLMAVSGAAGFAIGHESGDRDGFDQVAAQRGPDGDGPRGDGDGNGERGRGYGNGERGYGERGYGDRDGGMGGHHGMEGRPGMPDDERGYGRDRMPGMGDLPTPEEMLQWLQDQGVDMQQFMEEFAPGGMGQGPGQGPGQGMRQSS